MASRVHATTRWIFDTKLENVATATTLGGATRHDFAAKTIYIPESSVTFLSAIVEVTGRMAFATVRSLVGIRIGIKLGAVAFSDLDYTPTFSGNTALAYSWRFTRNVTSYFTTNWSGTCMAAQVGIAVATQTD